MSKFRNKIFFSKFVSVATELCCNVASKKLKRSFGVSFFPVKCFARRRRTWEKVFMRHRERREGEGERWERGWKGRESKCECLRESEREKGEGEWRLAILRKTRARWCFETECRYMAWSVFPSLSFPLSLSLSLSLTPSLTLSLSQTHPQSPFSTPIIIGNNGTPEAWKAETVTVDFF